MARGLKHATGWLFAVLAGLLAVACASRQEVGEGAPEDPQALVGYGAEVYGYSCGRCHNARAAAERTDREWETVVDHMRVRANLTGREGRAVTAFMRALNVTPAERVVYDTVVVADTLVRIDSVFVMAERPEGAVPADTARAEPAPARPAEPPAPARPEARPPAPDLTAIGAELVAARGCPGCHMLGGRGGTIGPALDGVVEVRGESYVRRKLRDPRFNKSSTVMPAFGLAEAELDAIVAYLRSLGG